MDTHAPGAALHIDQHEDRDTQWYAPENTHHHQEEYMHIGAEKLRVRHGSTGMAMAVMSCSGRSPMPGRLAGTRARVRCTHPLHTLTVRVSAPVLHGQRVTRLRRPGNGLQIGIGDRGAIKPKTVDRVPIAALIGHTHRSASPSIPALDNKAAVISSESGTDLSTSSIGLSMRASSAENRPTVKNISVLERPKVRASSSHILARTIAVTISSCGFSSNPDRRIKLTQVVMCRVPSRRRACRRESTFAAAHGTPSSPHAGAYNSVTHRG